MKNYKLLSDAILDGAKLRPQGRLLCVDAKGRTCAFGAAIHAVTGAASDDFHTLSTFFKATLVSKEPCPAESDDCCMDARAYTVASLIPHLNDDHLWSREQIAAFVATVEERLGLCEIISDELIAKVESDNQVFALAGNQF